MVDPLRHALRASFPGGGALDRTHRFADIAYGSCK